MTLLRNRLGRRVVAAIILMSALLSLVATAIQLLVSYRAELDRVLMELDIVDQSFIPSIEHALRDANYPQLDTLMDGILAQPDIVRIVLTTQKDRVFSRDSDVTGPSMQRRSKLYFDAPPGPREFLGDLDITLSLESVRSRIFSQFFTILASNLLKTSILAVIFLWLFDRMVSRHLRKISDGLGDVQWPDTPLELDRSNAAGPDDLDDIVAQLNTNGARVSASQREVREFRDRLNTVLNAATSGIIALDSNGQVAMININARHFLGMPGAKVPFDWPHWVKFKDADSHQTLVASADPLRRALNGHEFRYETHLIDRTPAGTEHRYVRVSSTKLETPMSEISVVLVIDDISNEERNRQVVERKNRLDALGQLTGGIAHDFNNLLASQLYAIDLAGKTTDPQKQKRFFEIAHKSIENGRELTKRLLAFARRQPGSAQSLAISDIFQDFGDLVRPLLEAKIELNFTEVDPALHVLCDQAQLETALMNLVLNSRDAILRDGKGTKIDISARLVSALAHEDMEQAVETSGTVLDALTALRKVEISVSDNGPGMDAETLSRSTDPFFSTKDISAGTGLGLAMVYGFANQSDGDFRIYSEEGVGTTVQLTLPLGDAADQSAAVAPQETLERGAGQTIFLVEDEFLLRALIEEVLEDLGYEVVLATSGQDAARLIDDGLTFDLLLTDVIMPGRIGGFELARLVRDKFPHMPVIYSSGYTGYTKEEMGAVTAPILQKPVSPNKLAAELATALRQSAR